MENPVIENGNESKPLLKTLAIDYAKYKTTFTKKFLERKPWKKRNIGEVTAFIPGIIKKIYVKQGSKVKLGDKLVVLEAMKMKNELLAPVQGIVKEITVKENSRVTKNQVIIVLE